MSYLVLARKYRPQKFSELTGQEHVSQTLQNAIDSGRVAHAFLFTGARGVGKTSSARILAKTLNCEQGPTIEPCNVCPACEEITAGNSVDVFEIDGASNTGVDAIRELRDNVKYLPSRCRYKIFIIDEVHMLSTSAFNALLKTLEEPPPHVKFIFATTEPHKVPVTILSRCQRFDFKRIPLHMIIDRLRYIVQQEGITVSDAALTVIARKGDGSMRDSLSTLDQVLAFCGDRVDDAEVAGLLGVVDRRLLAEAAAAVLGRDCAAALATVRRVDEFGYNVRHFTQELIDYFRTLLLFRAVDNATELVDLAAAEQADVTAQAAGAELSDLQRHLTVLLRTEAEMAASPFAKLHLELALVKMASMPPLVPVTAILERLSALEASGAPPLVAGHEPAWQGTPRARPAPAPPKSQAPAHRPPATPPLQPPSIPAEAPTAPPAPARTAAGEPTWPDFVALVRERKPILGQLLEKGRPLAVGSDILQLGFARGSFELSRIQDRESQAVLQELAAGYFGPAVQVRLVPLSDNQADAPLSLAEKKSLDAARRRQELQEVAAGHPLVKATLELFGGTIDGVEEL